MKGDRLGDVGRGIIDHHRLPEPCLTGAVGAPGRPHLIDDLADKRHRGEAGVDVRSHRRDVHPWDQELRRQGGCDCRRRFPLSLGERKGGEGEVSVGRFGRFDAALYVRDRRIQRSSQCPGKCHPVARVDGAVHCGTDNSGVAFVRAAKRDAAPERCPGKLYDRAALGGWTTDATVLKSSCRRSGFSNNPSIRSLPFPPARLPASLAPEMTNTRTSDRAGNSRMKCRTDRPSPSLNIKSSRTIAGRIFAKAATALAMLAVASTG